MDELNVEPVGKNAKPEMSHVLAQSDPQMKRVLEGCWSLPWKPPGSAIRGLNQEKHSFPEPHFLKFALEELW